MTDKQYIKKYKEIYKDIPEKQKKKASALIEKLAEVLVMMEECKTHLDQEGCVSEMPQGNYSIWRVNPWSQAYDAKAKIYASLIDKLDKMLPDQKTATVSEAGEALASFISSGKPVKAKV